MMKIYTGTGDEGETSLFGGRRVRKDSDRIAAYGTVDELNASIGVAAAACTSDSLVAELQAIQHELFMVGADLATPAGVQESRTVRVREAHGRRLEAVIDRFQDQLEPLREFILPGGIDCAAALHYARTVCRRAERLAFTLAEREEVNGHLLVYLNRLSDLLFVLARHANREGGNGDIPWRPDTVKK
jgi:cob(I)alamin adenosyltransferase